MYLPSQFDPKDPQVAVDIMQTHPFASLISTDDVGLPFAGFNLTAVLLYGMANVSTSGRAATERPGNSPANIASYRIPRVPATACSLPLATAVRVCVCV